MKLSILGRCALGVCAATAMLAGCGGQTGGSAVPAVTSNGDLLHHHSFYYTGAKQSFKVPTGVKSIKVVARGAGGAPLSYYSSERKKYGRAGRIHAVIPVRPGETLYVFVGGKGSGFDSSGGSGFNGGGAGGLYDDCGGRSRTCYGNGGGGATDVREYGDSVNDRILVVGGGGGAGTCGVIGGGGGGKVGGNGASGTDCDGTYFYKGGGGGDGGTQSQGGSGGFGQYGTSGTGGPGNPGTLGKGGSGGEAGYDGSFCSSCSAGAGGGGGGGYYGGGGGGGACSPSAGQPLCGLGGGGGGGSSYAESSATNVQMWQNWKNATGNGLVVFSW